MLKKEQRDPIRRRLSTRGAQTCKVCSIDSIKSRCLRSDREFDHGMRQLLLDLPTNDVPTGEVVPGKDLIARSRSRELPTRPAVARSDADRGGRNERPSIRLTVWPLQARLAAAGS